MAKFYGTIGYVDQVENVPGVWKSSIIERSYYGDILRNRSRYQAGDKINDDLNISNEISILADPYAKENFHKMRYIEFMGGLWKITGVEVNFPRLNLTIGGVYNGPTAGSSGQA